MITLRMFPRGYYIGNNREHVEMYIEIVAVGAPEPEVLCSRQITLSGGTDVFQIHVVLFARWQR